MIGAGGALIVATRNAGKTKEFREAFRKLGIEVRDLRETDGIPEIEETGSTFEENAYLKAKAVADIVGLPVLADDSGLCVDALGGAPGVYSARYAGEPSNDAANNEKLLRELARVAGGEPAAAEGAEPVMLLSPARFKCALVLYDPAGGSHLTAEGAVEGGIMDRPRGSEGFGYDPLFWVTSMKRGMAELTLDEKNEISHRGVALRLLLRKLANAEGRS
ncbi:XTP/dITP diphosphatase [Paenibacillaceae bacterium WGS1546]|uniref:XTP/dITP diphosphatase n=1 Tax=Cohnella sp. WGS1546 TaxID=3366810 RepID=UPI00372CF0AB